MVLSRKANDQNRTILVIYSNHPPTNFGIITDSKACGTIAGFSVLLDLKSERIFDHRADPQVADIAPGVAAPVDRDVAIARHRVVGFEREGQILNRIC